MALPARCREPVQVASAGKVTVTIDMREPCLLCYPLPEWEIVQRKLEALDNINPSVRLLQRLLVGHATDLELDGSGRLNLTAPLCDYAGLEKKVVLVGQGNKIEIWSEANWSERMARWVAEDGDSAAELLANLDAFTGLSV